LQTVRRQLEEYEEKLHFCRMLTESSLECASLSEAVTRWAEEQRKRQPAFTEALGELEAICSRNDSAEAQRTTEENGEILR